MILEILNHTYQYEAEKLLRVFFRTRKSMLFLKKPKIRKEPY